MGVPPAAHFTLMGSFSVVKFNPCVEFLLQLVDGLEDGFAERDLIKLLQDGFVEAFADGRWFVVILLWFRVFDVVDG